MRRDAGDNLMLVRTHAKADDGAIVPMSSAKKDSPADSCGANEWQPSNEET
jgi:hypothetical protein